MRLLTLLILIVLGIVAGVQAQEEKENHIIEFMKKEKLRVNPEELLKKLNEGEIDLKEMRSGKLNKSDRIHSGSSHEILPGNYAESEVHAALNPMDSSNIIVSPIRADQGWQGRYQCPIYYTTDFGSTWEESEFQNYPLRNNSMVQGGGDPVLVFDSKGTAYITWISIYITLKPGQGQQFEIDSLFSSLFFAKSVDGGKTWKFVDDGIVGDIDYAKYYGNQSGSLERLVDKQWMAVDLNDNSPYKDNVYMCGTYIDMRNMSDIENNIVFYRKEAGKNKFEKNAVVISNESFNYVQFSSASVDDKGHIHVSFYGLKGMDISNTSLYHSVSKDGGKTFSEPNLISRFTGSIQVTQAVEPETVAGITSRRLYPSPYIAADYASEEFAGNLYIVWQANGITENLENGMDIYFSRSTDGGETWSEAKVVNNDPKGTDIDNYNPTITVNKKGKVIITWYDMRHSSTNTEAIYYIAVSHDGGVTFPTEQRVTYEPVDATSIGRRNNNFGFGEYNGLIATDYYAIPIWSYSTELSGNLNVFAAFMPIDGISTGVQEVRPIINSDYTLKVPAPNPAGSNFTVSFEIKKAMNVVLDVLDMAGNVVLNIAKSDFPKGIHNIPVESDNLNSGSYLIRFSSEYGWSVQKIIIQK